MNKKKGKKSLIENFEIYVKKDGTETIRHKLARGGHNTKYTGMLDRYCRDADINDLKQSLDKMQKSMKLSYNSAQDCLQARLEIKIVEQWYKYKLTYGTTLDILPPSQDSDTGIITTRRADNTPEFLSVDLSEDEDYFIYRNTEGNIVYTYSGSRVIDEPTDYTSYQPTGLKKYGTWNYYKSSQEMMSGQAYKTGTYEAWI